MTCSSRASITETSSVRLERVGREVLGRLEPEEAGFLERVRRHRLGPMAYTFGMSEFRGDYLASMAVFERRQVAALELADALAERGIDSIPVKGMSYLHWLYDDPAVRPMSDIDLLVRPAAHENACSVLESRGYQRFEWTGSRSILHHASTFHRGRQYVDLHRNIVQPLRTGIDTDALFERARLGRGGVRRLCLVDTALIHFAHIARSELYVPALAYIEGALLLELLSPAEHSELSTRARAYRIDRGIRSSIEMTRSLTTAERWKPGAAWARTLPQPDEVLAGDLPPRPIQILRKLALCDDARSAAGLVGGAIIERFFHPSVGGGE